MKLLDIDWADFIEQLTEWERLSLPARKAFVELKSNQGKEATDFGVHAPDLAAAGFLRRRSSHRDGFSASNASPAHGSPFRPPQVHQSLTDGHGRLGQENDSLMTIFRLTGRKNDDLILQIDVPCLNAPAPWRKSPSACRNHWS